MRGGSKFSHFCSDLQHEELDLALNNLCVRGRSHCERLDMKFSDGWGNDLFCVHLPISTCMQISVRIMCLWSLWTAITGTLLASDDFWSGSCVTPSLLLSWALPGLGRGILLACLWIRLAAVNTALAGTCNWSSLLDPDSTSTPSDSTCWHVKKQRWQVQTTSFWLWGKGFASFLDKGLMFVQNRFSFNHCLIAYTSCCSWHTFFLFHQPTWCWSLHCVLL